MTTKTEMLWMRSWLWQTGLLWTGSYRTRFRLSSISLGLSRLWMTRRLPVTWRMPWLEIPRLSQLPFINLPKSISQIGWQLVQLPRKDLPFWLMKPTVRRRAPIWVLSVKFWQKQMLKTGRWMRCRRFQWRMPSNKKSLGQGSKATFRSSLLQLRLKRQPSSCLEKPYQMVQKVLLMSTLWNRLSRKALFWMS